GAPFRRPQGEPLAERGEQELTSLRHPDVALRLHQRRIPPARRGQGGARAVHGARPHPADHLHRLREEDRRLDHPSAGGRSLPEDRRCRPPHAGGVGRLGRPRRHGCAVGAGRAAADLGNRQLHLPAVRRGCRNDPAGGRCDIHQRTRPHRADRPRRQRPQHPCGDDANHRTRALLPLPVRPAADDTAAVKCNPHHPIDGGNMTTEIPPKLSGPALEAYRLVASMQDALLAGANEADQGSWIGEDASTRLNDGGIYRMLAPKRYGGGEFTVRETLAVLTKLAEGSPSAAWAAGIHNAAIWLASLYPVAAQDELFKGPEPTVVSGTLAPLGTLEKAPGGYRITGKWGFASGVLDATWILLGAPR